MPFETYYTRLKECIEERGLTITSIIKFGKEEGSYVAQSGVLAISGKTYRFRFITVSGLSYFWYFYLSEDDFIRASNAIVHRADEPHECAGWLADNAQPAANSTHQRTIQVDPSNAIAHSRDNVSNLPVTTARYLIEIVMNEGEILPTPEAHKQALANEFQRALDNGFFEGIQYDYLEFAVVDREVLDVAPANREVLDVAPANCPEPPVNACPYCGSKADIVSTIDVTNKWFVKCVNNECGAAGPHRESQGDAADSWNKISSTRTATRSVIII